LLSSHRAELAVAERSSGSLGGAIRSFMQSVRDFPSGTAIVRACFGLAGGSAGLRTLRSLRQRKRPAGFLR
jgi:hypothetical protein